MALRTVVTSLDGRGDFETRDWRFRGTECDMRLPVLLVRRVTGMVVARLCTQRWPRRLTGRGPCLLPWRKDIRGSVGAHLLWVAKRPVVRCQCTSRSSGAFAVAEYLRRPRGWSCDEVANSVRQVSDNKAGTCAQSRPREKIAAVPPVGQAQWKAAVVRQIHTGRSAA